MSNDHFDLIYGEIFGQSNSIGQPEKKKQKKESHKDLTSGKKEKTKSEAAGQAIAPVKADVKPTVDLSDKKEDLIISDKNKRKLKVLRKAGNQEWLDNSLADWPENDFRIYCCNLGNEVSDDILSNAFKKFTSFQMCKVIKDKKTEKSKGYGFVSLLDCQDYIRAMREMQGKYVGNRPIKLLPSKWTDKSINHGFGVLEQGNDASIATTKSAVMKGQPQSLTDKYAHLISEKDKSKIDSILAKRDQQN